MKQLLNGTLDIVVFDIESTGTNITEDAIVSICIKRYKSDMQTPVGSLTTLIRPWRLISAESTAIHGITDEMVKDAAPFHTFIELMYDLFNDAVIVGYNSLLMDLPMLAEELFRAMYKHPELKSVCQNFAEALLNQPIVDVCTIFKRREERNLKAAYQFFCGKTLHNTHQAEADTDATLEILYAQLHRYTDLLDMPVAELALYSNYDKKIADLANKLAYNEKGDVVYNFGQNTKGVRVIDDPGFAEWILDRNFPQTTKNTLRKILNYCTVEEDDDGEYWDGDGELIS